MSADVICPHHLSDPLKVWLESCSYESKQVNDTYDCVADHSCNALSEDTKFSKGRRVGENCIIAGWVFLGFFVFCFATCMVCLCLQYRDKNENAKRKVAEKKDCNQNASNEGEVAIKFNV